MKRVLVADDHAIVRKGLTEVLGEEFGKLVVGEAANARQALDLVARQNWDLALVDINMEGRSGIELLSDIKRVRPSLPVLVVSMYPEEEFATRALRSGAAGYLSKKTAADELGRAARKVLAGGRYVSATLAERLATELKGEGDKPRHETLSNREYQVMCLIAQGRSIREIAAELALSEKTVNTYRSRVMEKLGTRTAVEVTRYAMQNRLVE